MSETPITKRVQTLVEETTHTVANSPQKLIDASRGAIHMTREEAEHLVDRGEDLFDKLAERGNETTHRVAKSPQRLIDASRGAIHMTREEADHLMERGEDLFDKLAERGMEVERMQSSRITEWWKGWEQRGRHQVTVAEEQMEQSLQSVLRTLHIPTLDDVKRLDKDIDRVAKKLDAFLTERELASLPIAEYKGMNAKDVIAHLDTLDLNGLKAVESFELAHHNRKTILREIDQRMAAMA